MADPSDLHSQGSNEKEATEADSAPHMASAEDDTAAPQLHAGLLPTLDGEPLLSLPSEEGEALFTTQDGVPVEKEREDDIVFLNPGAQAEEHGWWSVAGLEAARGLLFSDERFVEPPRHVDLDGEAFSQGDVAAMLVAAGESFAPAGRSEPSPATFHRRLLAFLDASDSEESDSEQDNTSGAAHAPTAAETDDIVGWDYGFWKATLVTLERKDTPTGAASFEATVFWGEANEPSVYRYWILDQENPSHQLTGAGWHERPPPMKQGDAEFAVTALDERSLDELFPIIADDTAGAPTLAVPLGDDGDDRS